MDVLNMSRRAGAALVLATTSMLAAAPFGGAQVPAEIGRMVPDGAFVLAYTDSIQDFQQAVTGTVTAVEPQMAMMVAMGGPASSLNMMVKKADGGPGSAGVKVDGAAAFFMGPVSPTTGMVVQGAIFEVADADGVVAMSPAMSITRLDDTNWVALTNQTYALPSTANTLDAGMLDSTISVNLDQAAVVAAYKPQIDAMLAMMQMPPPEGVLTPEQAGALQRSQAANVAKVKMFLDMIASWNIGIDLNGADLDALLRTVPTDQSCLVKPSGGLVELARLVPADMPITAVMDHSAMALMMEMSKGDLEMLPPDAKARMEALWPLWTKSLKSMKSGVAMGMSFGEKGVSMVAVMDTDEPETALASIKEGWEALDATGIGISTEPLAILRGTGVGYKVKIDFRRLMTAFGMDGMMPPPVPGQPDPMVMMQGMVDSLIGETGLLVRYFIEADHIVSVIGNSRLAEARSLVAGGGAANRLSDLLTNNLAPSTWAVDIDARAVAGEGLALGRQMLGPMGAMLPPSLPAGDPIPFSIVGSSNGTSWDQCRVRTNIKDWYTFMQQLQPAPPPVTAGGSATGGTANAGN